ncbi:hypothetical protein AUK22_06225 [bacterium CG2_30_54_10]|nr:MAG: hypothetical protein AUK22_06225 [bacterium CG2_30_54_10]
MDRGLRVQIFERNNLLVLVDKGYGDNPLGNFTENAVSHEREWILPQQLWIVKKTRHTKNISPFGRTFSA